MSEEVSQIPKLWYKCLSFVHASKILANCDKENNQVEEASI